MDFCNKFFDCRTTDCEIKFFIPGVYIRTNNCFFSVKKIIICYTSLQTTRKLIFSSNNLTQCSATLDYCDLYFNTIFSLEELQPDFNYYGTYVRFTKLNQGYNLYFQILQSLSGIFTDPKKPTAILDFTSDDEVELSIGNMYGSNSNLNI